MMTVPTWLFSCSECHYTWLWTKNVLSDMLSEVLWSLQKVPQELARCRDLYRPVTPYSMWAEGFLEEFA